MTSSSELHPLNMLLATDVMAMPRMSTYCRFVHPLNMLLWLSICPCQAKSTATRFVLPRNMLLLILITGSVSQSTSTPESTSTVRKAGIRTWVALLVRPVIWTPAALPSNQVILYLKYSSVSCHADTDAPPPMVMTEVVPSPSTSSPVSSLRHFASRVRPSSGTT